MIGKLSPPPDITDQSGIQIKMDIRRISGNVPARQGDTGPVFRI